MQFSPKNSAHYNLCVQRCDIIDILDKGMLEIYFSEGSNAKGASGVSMPTGKSLWS